MLNNQISEKLYTDFFLSIIPIGNADWKRIVNSIAYSVILHDNAYKCSRYFDTLENYMSDLPSFFPRDDGIKLDDNIRFRIVIGCSILEANHPNNNKMILTPWYEEKILAKDAQWITMDKCIIGHSDYVIIATGMLSNEDKENMDKVMEFCKQRNRKYIIVNDKNTLQYKDIYKYFIENEGQ